MTSSQAQTFSNPQAHGLDDGSGEQAVALGAFMRDHPRLFVITGAGLSQASGIPTYRDRSGTWRRSQPIQHGAFLADHAARQRYWARSYFGWPAVAAAQPNDSHHALVRLQQKGYVGTLLTQNIDRLHQRAGHREVYDLHGRLDRVLCMDCGAVTDRQEIQGWLAAHNPQLGSGGGAEARLAPDGDADVDPGLVAGMQVPSCHRCGGLLKPDVVFYGGAVAKALVAELGDRLQQADALLVLGSSLMVYSSFRFCRQAAASGIPMACVNLGMTRADELFQLKLAADCGPLLARLASLLPVRAAAGA